MAQFPAIVITGMGFVTPIGHDRAAVCDAIRAGRTGIVPQNLDGILPLLVGRIDPSSLPSHGGDAIADFAISSTKDAWKQANPGDDVDPWRVATVVGSSKGRTGSILSAIHPAQVAFDVSNFPGETLGTSVAQTMGFAGPVLCYPAACATGIHAIIRGAQLLQTGDADMTVAGTGEAGCRSLVMASFKNMGALSSGPILPFDRRRNGFNPGEGMAVFVLEREEDALARNAPIVAKVAGWDQRGDAHHMTSADPNGTTLAYSIRRTLERACWDTEDVEYINAHGTGTPLNDRVEGASIGQVFGRENPPVSSLKPNIGHLLGASAAVELALSIACLEQGFIPPTLGLDEPDPDIPLQFVPAGGINRPVKRFIKLSLGFGGHIGVLAIELPG